MKIRVNDNLVITYSDDDKISKVEKPLDNIEVEIFFDGDKIWYKNGRYHRDGDKPAWVKTDGTKYWYQNGELHRDGDKPAAIESNGSKYWFQNGSVHRDDNKPAVIYFNGSKEYWENGRRVKRKKKI